MTRLVRICFFLALSVSCASSQTRLWEELNGVAGFFTIEEGGGGRLFGIRGNGIVYTSDDKGLSWQGSTVLGGQILAIRARGNTAVVARNNPNAVNFYQFHLTTDNGATWTRITTASSTNRQLIGVSDAGSLYGYFRDSFFGQPAGPYWLIRYDGTGWPLLGSLPQTASVNGNGISSVLVDHEGTILFGTSRAGLFITRDEGLTWEQSYEGRGITALSLTPDDRIYLAADPTITDGGVYVSSNGGVSWTYLGFSEKIVSTLSADSAGNLLASTADGIYRYTGNIDAWEFTSPFSDQFDVMLSAGKDTVLTSNGAWGLFRSIDGGSSWIQSGPRQRDVFSIVQTSSGTTVAGTLGARIFRSSDDGSNWEQAAAGSICDNVTALAEAGGVLFAGTECGLYRSTDEGRNWTLVESGDLNGPVSSLAIEPDGDIYAGTMFGAVRSADGGLTWHRAGLDADRIVSLCAGPAGELYALADQTGVYGSSDDGANWSWLGLARSGLQSIHADALGTLFVAAYGGILRSTGAGSWEEHFFTSGYVSSVASLGTQSVYAATAQGIYVSSDGGGSWNAFDNSGLSNRNVLSLAFDARGVLFAGTYNGGVFRTNRTLTGVGDAPALPAAFALAQNYPNPFNPETMIEYSVPAASVVTLTVSDILGREVATLVKGPRTAGRHRIQWSAAALPAGVYFYRMQAGPFAETKKMLLVR